MNVHTKFEFRIALSIPEIIGVLQKFGESLDSPTLPILPDFKRAYVRMDPMNMPAYLKFVALPVPEIIGGTQKIWAVPVPRSLFSKIFHKLVFGWTL